jgi:hypothetical protein
LESPLSSTILSVSVGVALNEDGSYDRLQIRFMGMINFRSPLVLGIISLALGLAAFRLRIPFLFIAALAVGIIAYMRFRLNLARSRRMARKCARQNDAIDVETTEE